MPYSRKAKYRHHRKTNPNRFNKSSFKTVPLSHTNYSGKKFKGKRNKAIVGKLKKRYRKGGRKWKIQSILERK